MDHTHHPAIAQHQDLVAEGHHDIQILTHKQDAHPILLLLVEDIVNGIGRIDVQTPHRIGSHNHIGPCLDLPAQQHLLDVTAGKAAHRRFRRRGDDPQLLDDMVRVGSSRLPVHKGTFAVPVVFQDHVINNGQRRSQSHSQTILRNK